MPGIETYYASIAHFPMLTSEEEKVLGEQAREGSEEAQRKLVEGNLRLVVRIAGTYANSGIEFDDLVAIGNLGLMRAARKFDPSKDAKFTTYAGIWIKAFIRAEIAKRQNDSPSNSVSADELVYRDSEGSKVRVVDMIPTEAPGPFEELARRQDLSVLRQVVDEVLAEADERDQDIFLRHTGLKGKDKTVLRVLADQYGLTCEGVRCIVERNLGKLCSRMRERLRQ